MIEIRGPMLASLFGVADESGNPDETMLSTVNVRLDQIFSVFIRGVRELVAVNRYELEKLIGLAGVEARELKLAMPVFDPVADGIPDDYVQAVNDASEKLARNASGRAPWALIQTPMLRYRRAGRRIQSEVWTRIVIPVARRPSESTSARRQGANRKTNGKEMKA